MQHCGLLTFTFKLFVFLPVVLATTKFKKLSFEITFLPTATSFLINGASDLPRKMFIRLQNEETFFYVGGRCSAEGRWSGWKQREKAGEYSERRGREGRSN